MFKGGKIPTLKLDNENAVELKAELEKMKEDIALQTEGIAGQLEELVFSLASDTKHKYAYVVCTAVEEEEEDGFSLSASLNFFPSDEPDLKCAMKFVLEPIRAYIETSGKRYWGTVKYNQAEMIEFIKVWQESHLEREQK